MGLPIWKPKNEHSQQHQKLQSPPKLHASPTPHHSLQPHYRLYRRPRPTRDFSYYLAPDYHHHQDMLHPLTTEELQYDHHFPPLRSHAAEEQHQNQQHLEQQVNEKQEFLDQLNITISLLDQFLSIREMSGQEDVPLPPLITDDLLSILSATNSASTSTSGRSYDQGPPSSSIDTSSHTSRLADLESRIVSAHQQISDRLNLLGAIFPLSHLQQ